MTKQEALVVLINHSYILQEQEKMHLVELVPKLSEQELDLLGTFLAIETKNNIKNLPRQLTNLTQVIDILTKKPEAKPEENG